MTESLQEIICRLWTTPEHAEWTPKIDVVALSDVQRWAASGDIEILGFTYAMLSNRRFRIEPPITLDGYVSFLKHYIGRCLRENPDGEWSDSRHSAGTDLVNIFAGLWRDESVPRLILKDLKAWIEAAYKEGDEDFRQCSRASSFQVKVLSGRKKQPGLFFRICRRIQEKWQHNLASPRFC
jgi:hypothetical protein